MHYIHFSYLMSWPRWPFPVPFLHVLPARPSRHSQLVETQLSTIQVLAQAYFPPLLKPAFKVTCAPVLPQPGCMFPSCLPLLFNAKVLAKDIFLLLLCFSILFCTVAAPCPNPGHCPLAGPIHGSKPLGAQGRLGCSVSSWVMLMESSIYML